MIDNTGDAAFRKETLLGSEFENTFSGALSYMRRKYSRNLEGVDVAVTGIPFDHAVSNRPGTRFGPEAVRKATAQHAFGTIWPWRFDPFDTLAVVDYGDLQFDYGHIETIAQEIEEHIAAIISQGASSLAIGGDHFVTYPILKAYAKKYGPLGFVQFDSHRDVDPTTENRIDHGSMFAKAIEEGLIDAKRSIQVGIRTYYGWEEEREMKILYANDVQGMSAAEIAREIKSTLGDGESYLTFDIDFLDPAYAPGTGTPVPGGPSTFQALDIIREMKGLDFVGMDLVEVSPPYDHSEITANAAALVSIELLCLKAWARGARG